jgi:KaiC/GvpD/RAD55 family RecA-like ATPase
VVVLLTFMLGGIFDGSTTMVVGISGAGKTVLGVQLLLEGVLKQGKRGLLIRSLRDSGRHRSQRHASFCSLSFLRYSRRV